MLLTAALLSGLSADNPSSAEELQKLRETAQPDDEMISPALRWLAAQPNEDGSWTSGEDKRAAAPTETTGLAVQAFLSAGQTHREGAYGKPVHAGLAYLIKQIKVEENRGDLRGPGGDLTAHAIATLALCEAYAVTHDKELLGPAQMGVNFIAARQDEESGGWKDDAMASPSVVTTAWQLLAVKNAHMAYLQVNKNAIVGATKFLDQVQLDEGAAYPNPAGRRDRQAGAAGLLCRMMLGWKRKRPQVVQGLAAVGKGGPRPHDVVANYFAHQLHRECAGEAWPAWSNALRKQLHDTQLADGDNAGSWRDTDDPSFPRVGAIGQTALSVIMLRTGLHLGDLLRRPDDEDEFEL